jgi:hypothetical protein
MKWNLAFTKLHMGKFEKYKVVPVYNVFEGKIQWINNKEWWKRKEPYDQQKILKGTLGGWTWLYTLHESSGAF